MHNTENAEPTEIHPQAQRIMEAIDSWTEERREQERDRRRTISAAVGTALQDNREVFGRDVLEEIHGLLLVIQADQKRHHSSMMYVVGCIGGLLLLATLLT
jgi:hypothetical protein